MDTQELDTMLEKLVKSVDRLETDTSYDRDRFDKKFAEMGANIEELNQKLDILLDAIPRMKNNIRDGVTAAVEPLRKELKSAAIPIDKTNRKWIYNAIQALKGWGVKK